MQLPWQWLLRQLSCLLQGYQAIMMLNHCLGLVCFVWHLQGSVKRNRAAISYGSAIVGNILRQFLENFIYLTASINTMSLFSFLKKQEVLTCDWCGTEIEECSYVKRVNHKEFCFCSASCKQAFRRSGKGRGVYRRCPTCALAPKSWD